MSSSSRSIAAARQKRAGEQSQQMNTSRPVTSISSQGAFAHQYQQQMMSKSIPISSKNVRSAQNINQGSGQNINQGSGVRSNTNIIQNNQADQSTKISISNAVGLITLRLGRLESIINDSIENGGLFNNNDNNDNNDNNTNATPHNMKLVSDEVFENIVNRINLLESKVIQFTNQNEKLEKLENEMTSMQSSIVALNTTLSLFINDTNEKFVDYENALTEIEKNIENNNDDVIITTEQNVDAKSAVEIDESMNNNSVNTNDLESDNKTNNDNDNETN
jgi:hypothetical protein